MMVRRIAILLTATLATASVAAQGPAISPLRPPVPRPTVSPYLSLLNRNNSMAFNYYEIYRPQRRFEQAINQVNYDVSRLQEDVRRPAQGPNPLGEYRLGPTGHPTMFMNSRGYFPALGPR